MLVVNVLETKCPSCGAMMRYDVKKALLVCDYCGTEQPVPVHDAQKKDQPAPGKFDFSHFQKQAVFEDAEELPIYTCASCGAEVIAAPEQFALTCPYCRNNIVLSDKVSGKLRPDGVVPFRIEAKELPERLTRFYRNKVLLPKRFFLDAKIENVTGVYVPFWVFNGNIDGTLQYSGSTSSTRYSGNYKITDTKHYAISRSVYVDFENLPVDASGRIEDAMMDSLEPFDLNTAQPFHIGYLAGFTAERFDAPAKDLEKRAKTRMENTASTQVIREVRRKYSNVSLTCSKFTPKLTARYLLLPVYLFDMQFEGKNYHFAVNGQTGKTVGHVPIGKKESRKHFWLRFGIIAGVILLWTILNYFLGR